MIHHGLSEAFESCTPQAQSRKEKEDSAAKDIRIGFVGNLGHPATAFSQLIQILQRSLTLPFELWGPDVYEGLDQPTKAMVFKAYRCGTNVIKHGRVSPNVIAESAERIDIWLACYDYRRDLNADGRGVPNSHKIWSTLLPERSLSQTTSLCTKMFGK